MFANIHIFWESVQFLSFEPNFQSNLRVNNQSKESNSCCHK